MNLSPTVKVSGAEIFNPVKKTDDMNFNERIFEIFKNNKQLL